MNRDWCNKKALHLAGLLTELGMPATVDQREYGADVTMQLGTMSYVQFSIRFPKIGETSWPKLISVANLVARYEHEIEVLESSPMRLDPETLPLRTSKFPATAEILRRFSAGEELVHDDEIEEDTADAPESGAPANDQEDPSSCL